MLQLAAGGDSSAAIDAEGRLLLWGRAAGEHGSDSPVPRVSQPPPGGSEEADGGSEQAVWRQVAVGWRHWVALDSGGRVWAWGNNQHGQCGTGSCGEALQQPTRCVSVH